VSPPLKPSLSSFLGMDLHLLLQPSLLGATIAMIGVATIDRHAAVPAPEPCASADLTQCRQPP
jgi:hypothetical protein